MGIALSFLLAVAPPLAIVADEANAKTPTPVAQAVAARLMRQGYEARVVATGLLAKQPVSLEAARMLVLVDAADLPASLAPPIERFLASKRDLIVFRGPAWQRPLVSSGGQWRPFDEVAEALASRPPDHVAVDFAGYDSSLWTRATDNQTSTTNYELADTPWGAKALHVTVGDLTSWDTYLSPELPDAFPPGASVTQFAAKGDSKTTRLAVEWDEKDGSRWIGTVPLTTSWRAYRLSPTEFHYWPSVPTRASDRFHPENALRVRIGLAFSHTGTVSGRHEYWIAKLGTSMAGGDESDSPSIAPVDGLYPAYKFFPIEGPIKVGDEAVSSVRSLQPRPQAAGFDKQRGWRYVPWATATSPTGAWRGIPIATTLWSKGAFAGSSVTAFGFQDAAYYTSEAALSQFDRIVAKLRNRLWLEDGGADVYTEFTDRPVRLGATVANFGGKRSCKVSISATPTGAAKALFTAEYDLELDPDETKKVETPWRPEWSASAYRIDVTISVAGQVVDRLTHSLYPWKPQAKSFVATAKGEFQLDGKSWRAHGVNYMPSSGIGLNDGDSFEYWIDRQGYDPVVVERDLAHIQDLGFNAISAFIYGRSVAARNLPDFLRRCEAHGLKVNLALRPGTPMEFDWAAVSSILKTFRLAECDTVFAYDLAWEPSFGDHEARRRWDAEWESWLVRHYGSLDDAEKAWDMPVPKENGRVTNPQDNQFVRTGPWRPVVAAYRRFLDELLETKNRAAVDQVRGLDRNHLISFRMAEAGNPTYDWPAALPYDFPGLARAVDFLAPEGYGRTGDWNKVRPGLFEVAYARAWPPLRPVVWAEAGMSTLDAASLEVDASLPSQQAIFFEGFYRMLRESHSNGVFWWWYPGGVRVGENSDYGIINPDGTDREVSKIIRKEGPRFLEAGPSPTPSVWLEFDRDRDPRGVAGVYEKLSKAFWDAIASGQTVGLKPK